MNQLFRQIRRATLLLAGVFTLIVRGQTPDLATVVEQLNALKAEVAATRAENAEMRQQLGLVETHLATAAKGKWPEIRLNVLGSIEYSLSTAPQRPNSVTLGDVDLVTTARVNEKASATSDYVVASDEGAFKYEIERLFVSYKINDSFNFDVGRFHTAMGWYNNFYHNGTYFQTARDRPAVFAFEDNGGILPVHSTGLSLNGEIPSGTANLSYSAEIANGRNYTANNDQSLQIEDGNDYKALNFQLRARPDRLSNWQFGAGIYHDTLTPVLDPANLPDITTRIDQLILSGFAIYKSPVIEWFTEGAWVGDKLQGDDRRWTFAGYTQLSQKFGPYRPYLRLQWQESAPGDPLLELIGQSVSSWDIQAGLRYDFTTMMALKFEYDHRQPRREDSLDEFSSQLSFRF